MRRFALFALLSSSLAGCYPWVSEGQYLDDNPPCEELDWFRDTDGDGFGDPDQTTRSCEEPSDYVSVDTDCDDSNPLISPAAIDLPYDTIDQDCDGTDLCDVDGDGVLSAECEGGLDCDDSDQSVFPFGTEVPYDGIDQDCDGSDLCDVDFDTLDDLICGGTDCDDADAGIGELSYYPDRDGDGFGDAEDSGSLCESQDDSDVSNADDCDDGNGLRFPGNADLVGDGVDNNCDGIPGVDSDGDGQPSIVSGGGDCDDQDPAVHPAVADLVDNGIDNNCDGVPGSDDDGDGFASQGSNGLDCDDNDPFQYPLAAEFCNGEDDDCDSLIDNNNPLDQTLWYPDLDGDDYGDENGGVLGCEAPANHVADGTDCDDGDGLSSPAAADSAINGVDNNCDGVPGVDADGDGLASDDSGGTDCDDANPLIFPGAVELPYDNIDQDCDGSDLCDVDADGLDAIECGGLDCDDLDPGIGDLRWFPDADGDGFGAEAPGTHCDPAQPLSDVLVSGDCDDQDAGVNPNGTEVCNGVDDNCNDLYDEGAVDAVVWYADTDGDGAGDPLVSVLSCTQEPGHVANADDCDDTQQTVGPGVPDTVANGIDDNCDGLPGVDFDGDGLASYDSGGLDCEDNNPGVRTYFYFPDTDLDGYGDPAGTADPCVPSDPTDVLDDTDCDDEDPALFPGQRWYEDADLDGFGGALSSMCSPADPLTDVLNSDDCDDTDPLQYPGVLWFWDDDGDGAGGLLAGECGPVEPTNVLNNEDCDDGDANVQFYYWYFDLDGDGVGGAASNACVAANPSDVPNSDDCDDSDPLVQAAWWYADLDGDTFGDPGSSNACTPLEISDTLDSRDCDDTDPDEHPGVIWYVDGDGDGFGADFSQRCDRALPTDVNNANDCDDADPGNGACGYTTLDIGTGGGCALDGDGTPHCWGDAAAAPWQNVPAGPFEILALGGFYACALDAAGMPTSWGFGGAGEPALPLSMLSAGMTATAGLNEYGSAILWGEPQWSMPHNEGWHQINLSDDAGCGINMDSRVECWGGQGPLVEPVTVVYDIIDSTSDGGCGIEPDGSISCFAMENATVLYDAPAIGDGFLQLSMDRWVVCGITESQSLHCWGVDFWGLLSDAPTEGRFIEVAVKQNAICALRSTGGILCWGNDQGNGNLEPECLDPTDTDGDSVCDANDICALGDDLLDSDADGIPDACE